VTTATYNITDDSDKETMSGRVDFDIRSENTASEAEEDSADESDEADASSDAEPDTDGSVAPRRHINWKRVLACGVLPGLALLLALGAGLLKWQDASVRGADLARIESAQVAKDSTIALLSYRPDTVDQQLGSARGLLTGDFKNSYTSVTTDVVIPGAKQKQILAAASVPAVASVSATPTHAVVLVFVNQTVVVGTDAPTDTASSVKATLDKISGRWLISAFDPI
jgi:Mce-associated membrane protein